MCVCVCVLDIYPISLPQGRHAIIPRKETRREERRKNGSGQKAKRSIPTQAIDERMGGRGKAKKTEEKQKKETESGTLT